MIQSFKNMVPVVDPSAYVHPMAVIIGHVTIGPDCYIGPGAVLRGDWGKITLERGCNVQENAVLHMFPKDEVHERLEFWLDCERVAMEAVPPRPALH